MKQSLFDFSAVSSEKLHQELSLYATFTKNPGWLHAKGLAKELARFKLSPFSGPPDGIAGILAQEFFKGVVHGLEEFSNLPELVTDAIRAELASREKENEKESAGEAEATFVDDRPIPDPK